ncbi:hypothetical protein BDD12DRAFT_514339 [Trichophaea hybrida]|nr:hypothetical protein BDD12DRAFT_514339 [Trichophaea hybrida]
MYWYGRIGGLVRVSETRIAKRASWLGNKGWRNYRGKSASILACLFLVAGSVESLRGLGLVFSLFFPTALSGTTSNLYIHPASSAPKDGAFKGASFFCMECVTSPCLKNHPHQITTNLLAVGLHNISKRRCYSRERRPPTYSYLHAHDHLLLPPTLLPYLLHQHDRRNPALHLIITFARFNPYLPFSYN